ncbi:glycosyltransferase family 2 protein [Aestuariimicrobium sp. Y1814]|uniref:glycosyltransferase family 2 protein n=1 Tax=Aestuariimicrobium sp. Y1814 TaxID=3418742 RepID=UPI003DA71319
MNGRDAIEVPNEPDVSVIIPCHNSTRTIGLQLQALSQQEGGPRFEVVLVDNLSTDDLAAATKPWRERLDVRVVAADAMANPGYARNVGVAHARARVVAFCDSDDYASRQWVREAASAAEQTPVTNGGATPMPEAEFGLGAEHLDGLLEAEPMMTTLEVPGAAVAYPILLGGSCVMRRDVYFDVGGCDVSAPYGVEDNDLALRLQAAGHVIARAHAMKLAYRTRPEVDQPLGRSFRTGVRHMLLAHRHHLFGRSPSLPRRWYLGLGRCAAAAARMLVRPSSRDWRSLGQRAALQAGLLVGHLRYGVIGRPPQPRLGVGLEGAR